MALGRRFHPIEQVLEHRLRSGEALVLGLLDLEGVVAFSLQRRGPGLDVKFGRLELGLQILCVQFVDLLLGLAQGGLEARDLLRAHLRRELLRLIDIVCERTSQDM